MKSQRLCEISVALLTFVVGFGQARAQGADTHGAPAPSSSAAPSNPVAPPAAPPVNTDAPAASSPSRDEDARIRELESRVKGLDTALSEVRAAEAKPSAPVASAPPTPPAPPAASAVPAPAKTDWVSDAMRGIVVTSYIQAQYESHEDSEDQVRQGGALLNQDRFLIRRGRLKIERQWDYSSVMVEFDGNTTKGPAFLLHHAEASLLWRGGEPAPAPPLVGVTMGLFDVPFGYELVESPRTRFFMERSLASRSFFPAEPDVGAKIWGKVGWFRYALAVVNGEPNGSADGYGLQDPNAAKDLIAKVGATIEPVPEVQIAGDVSVLNGKGFLRGTDATKNTLAWSDLNGDGRVATSSEVVGNQGLSALASQNFNRWAVSADLQVRIKNAIGWTQLYGEVQTGANMDRGLFVADPIDTGRDVRELGYYVGITQEITPYAIAGFRIDYYNPDADKTDTQQTQVVPTNQRVVTYSPLIGATLPGRARLLFQYDFIKDYMARDERGVPIDLKNDQWTLRLQGEL